MTERTKIDQNYLEAFNLGYELAKELDLKSPMFKDLNSVNYRMNAMQAGMDQFSNEIVQGKNKVIDLLPGFEDENNISKSHNSKRNNGTDKGKGLSI